jgi:serine/threonine protein kinase
MQGMPFSAGQVINQKYQIVGLLGEGGMGQVYKAQQLPLGRTVALKVMQVARSSRERPDEFRERFLMEASLCAKLTHPNILTIYDYGRIEHTAQEAYFIAMEHLEGVTLDERLQENPLGLPVVEALRLITEVTRGLREAHRKGVVHRDLKPANIMLVPGSEGAEHVKLLDFGLVKRVGEAERGLTIAGAFLGTPLYMPPEQVTPQKVDFRSDLYALGVILFECLTGVLPYDGENVIEILTEKKKQPPTLRAKKSLLAASDALQGLLNKLLQPSPDARFQTADNLLLALRNLPELRAVGGAAPTDSMRPPTPIEIAGRYQFGRQIAASGTARVYEGTHLGQGRKVAIKLFSGAHEREVARLQRDLPAMLSLQGPGLPTTFEVGVTRGPQGAQPFVIMEYVRGKTLKDLLVSEGRLEANRALLLLRHVLEGLAEIHAHGFVHRNLAPEHVLVSQSSGGRELATLISPGISAASDTKASSPSHTNDALGQLNRTAPEVLQGGRRTELSDLYAAGAVLYECLAGRLPISEGHMARCVAEGRLPGPQPLREATEGISRELMAFVDQALQPDPRERFSSATRMLDALERLPEAGNPLVPNSRRESLLSSLSMSHLRLWSRGSPSVWILGADPAFRKPQIVEALAVIQRRYDVTILDSDQQEALLQRVERHEVPLPWAVLFGDLDVILENPLLGLLGQSGELSRVLISTHSNPEMLRRSINFCGLDQSVCLPASAEEIAEAVGRMIGRAQVIRTHYDQLRRVLVQQDTPPVEIFIDSPASRRSTRAST